MGILYYVVHANLGYKYILHLFVILGVAVIDQHNHMWCREYLAISASNIMILQDWHSNCIIEVCKLKA